MIAFKNRGERALEQVEQVAERQRRVEDTVYHGRLFGSESLCVGSLEPRVSAME